MFILLAAVAELTCTGTSMEFFGSLDGLWQATAI
jgi:hypothetical protein